ncbi:MAG TPA: D-2-hydroxyacid dehydrogenase [Anaerolineales bacterium]|nr:D-2-hydroxyacid dehydrogenase [Anaerolineales bacterium]
MSDVLVLMTLRFPDLLVERLRAVSPRLRIEVHPAGEADDLPEALLGDVEILYTARALPAPETVPSLRWVQFHFAGIDHVADHPLLRSDVKITTLSGAATPQMGEFTLMCILALGRRLPRMERDRQEKRWADNRFERFRPLDLAGSTVGIVGYGSVGREVARLCHAFGAKVLATKRNLKALGDSGYGLDAHGDAGAEVPERLYPPKALRSMAALCDFLVVTVPLTPETRGMINRAVLQDMKPTACLIDISRGGVVDHNALVEALSEKRLGGAALDVYPVEPLPASSPLWEMPNVILSPHVAGGSSHYFEQAATLFAENLQRYLADQPLLNLYDPQIGY